MTRTTYRVDFKECIHGRWDSRCDAVSGDISQVQAHLDEYAWDIDSVTVTEYVGSDAAGRIVPMDEWYSE